MDATLSAMKMLDNRRHKPLVRLLGDAVATFADVTKKLSSVKVELLRLHDEKRRRIVAARDIEMALGTEAEESWRQRCFRDEQISALVDCIRKLEGDRIRLEAERDIYDRAIRALHNAIDLQARASGTGA